jgi:hypothetical protein
MKIQFKFKTTFISIAAVCMMLPTVTLADCTTGAGSCSDIEQAENCCPRTVTSDYKGDLDYTIINCNWDPAISGGGVQKLYIQQWRWYLLQQATTDMN